MARIRGAKDYCGTTLDSFPLSWEDRYFNTSLAYHTTTAFQLVNRMDSIHCLRDLPFHKTQSGAATMLRQSGNIFDRAKSLLRSLKPYSWFCWAGCRCLTHCLQWPMHGCQVSLSRRQLHVPLCASKNKIDCITILVLFCPTTLILSGLAPLTVSRLLRSSMIYC